MKKVVIMPVLAAVMFAVACSKDGDPIAVDTTAKIRFFNAVWNAPDGIAFTTNGQFAAGTKLAYGASTPTCSSLNAGNTTFGIGLANSSGTGLSSAELVTLNNQTIAAGGNYTVLAGGNAIHPSVVLLDNNFSGTLGSNQAAVRFVNLAAASEFPFTVVKGTAGSGSTTVVQTDLTFRSATPFSTVASGSNAYTIMSNNEAVISGAAATLNLQPGTINTVVINRLNPPSGNFELITVPSCN
jgi:hypothetical protein